MMIAQVADLVLRPVERHLGPMVTKHTSHCQSDQESDKYPDQKAHIHDLSAYPINRRSATNKVIALTTALTTKAGLEKNENFLLIYGSFLSGLRPIAI
ncbi:MAG TPA: hypothetical protein DD661_06825 [Gammaproteobacteria bacterium]|nr:hypothetical protein [Gammaproteobacteria bacterium]|tara:strand:+ start:794 stop:1087 length:294 start_codon:yes stop_codon:yes gene_type:complete